MIWESLQVLGRDADLKSIPLCVGLGSTSSGLIRNGPSLSSRWHGKSPKSPHCHLKHRHWGSVSLLRFIYFYMYECSVYMQCLQRPERTSELLTMESVKATSCHVAWVWVLWKSCPVMSPVLRLRECLLPHKLHPLVSPLSAPSTLASEVSLQPAQKSLSCFPLATNTFFSAASTALKKSPTSQIQDP